MLIKRIPGWCDYIVCDALCCPEDLSADFVARENMEPYLKGGLDFGPAVGTKVDPEFLTDDWV